jgi:hypothetical protein
VPGRQLRACEELGPPWYRACEMIALRRWQAVNRIERTMGDCFRCIDEVVVVALDQMWRRSSGSS